MRLAPLATVCGLLAINPLGCHGDGIVHLGSGSNISETDSQDATATDAISNNSARDADHDRKADSAESGPTKDAQGDIVETGQSDDGPIVSDSADTADSADALESGDAWEDIIEGGPLDDGPIVLDASDAAESPDALGACAPMDAHSHGLCFSVIGIAWNGKECVQIVCSCEGTDCDHMYSVFDGSCAADHKGCVSIDQ